MGEFSFRQEATQLPASPTVKEILEAFVQRRSKMKGGSTSAVVYEEISAGISEMFNKSLRSHLLYKLSISSMTTFRKSRTLFSLRKFMGRAFDAALCGTSTFDVQDFAAGGRSS